MHGKAPQSASMEWAVTQQFCTGVHSTGTCTPLNGMECTNTPRVASLILNRCTVDCDQGENGNKCDQHRDLEEHDEKYKKEVGLTCVHYRGPAESKCGQEPPENPEVQLEGSRVPSEGLTVPQQEDTHRQDGCLGRSASNLHPIMIAAVIRSALAKTPINSGHVSPKQAKLRVMRGMSGPTALPKALQVDKARQEFKQLGFTLSKAANWIQEVKEISFAQKKWLSTLTAAVYRDTVKLTNIPTPTKSLFAITRG
ncbi:hypothetical protein DFH08DRAFT_821092 [Mycena albidolilacea]|uniref:Uncharacterized protein n=1 Tax=Mycena albidolilacea TaxID=1033008 RepID=A0AAD6ZBS1_9AGAR|nr:hypothetical protein DFH08DRAFT_821092 [Mycena albidolilacea]